jgi:hypothetical protein
MPYKFHACAKQIADAADCCGEMCCADDETVERR